MNTDELHFTITDKIYTVIGLSLLIIDIVTDICVAFLYLANNRYYWFILTLLCVLIPSLVCSIISSVWYYQDYQQNNENGQDTVSSRECFFESITSVLLIAPVIRLVL